MGKVTLLIILLMLIVFALAIFTDCVYSATDAMDEVNRQRQAHGLFPFIRDEGLSQSAARVADVRAARHIQFHCNDSQYVPPGCPGWSSGAGVSSQKFMACYAEWPNRMPGESPHGGISGVSGQTVYAGAATALDEHGSRYCHLFVSGRPSGIGTRIKQAVSSLCEMASHRVYGIDAYTPVQAVQVVQPAASVAVGDTTPSHSSRRTLLRWRRR